MEVYACYYDDKNYNTCSVCKAIKKYIPLQDHPEGGDLYVYNMICLCPGKERPQTFFKPGTRCHPTHLVLYPK